MSLVIGTNSWATISEADEYLQHRIGATDWFNLPRTSVKKVEDTKENMLISAFYWLVYDPKYQLSSTLTCEAVKKAQIEAALFLLQSYSEYSKRSNLVSMGVKSFSFSKWRENLSSDIGKPMIVDDILTFAGFSTGTYLVDIQVD